MRLAFWTLALALVGACLSVTSSPAVASCAAGAGPAGSPTIFLGVAGRTFGGYTTMTVEEVWAGPELPASLRVLSGQTAPNVSSSVDADLRPGHRYVIGTDDKLRTNACTVEEVEDTASSEGAMTLRPDHVRRPVAHVDDDADRDSSGSLVIAGLVLGLAAGAAVWVVRVRARR